MVFKCSYHAKSIIAAFCAITLKSLLLIPEICESADDWLVLKTVNEWRDEVVNQLVNEWEQNGDRELVEVKDGSSHQ